MARTDIAGLLTGIPSGGIDPNMSPQAQQIAMAQQAAQGLQSGARGLMASVSGKPDATAMERATNRASTEERLQAGMSQLDLTDVKDLLKLAKIQQARGDLAGAAQTAARIQQIKQLEVEETRAEAREKRAISAERRAEESYEFGKIDRQERKDREKIENEISDGNAALRQAVTKEQLDDATKRKAAEATLRLFYTNEAKSRGLDELADRLQKHLPLDVAERLLYTSKLARKVVKPLTKTEVEAYRGILETEKLQAEIPSEFAGAATWWPLVQFEVGKTTDDMDNAIFLKTKQIAQDEDIPIEEAMSKAIGVLADLRGAKVSGGGEGGEGSTVDSTDQFSSLKKRRS